MKLRLHLPSSRPPPRWIVALLPGVAAVSLLIGSGPTPAAASTADYSTLYLSGATSSLLSGSDVLVTSAGPGQPATAPTVTASGSGPLTNATYNYEYTIVDPTGGETAPSPSGGVSGAVANGKSLQVAGLPTGATVRIYRQKNTGLFNRVAELTNSSSSYVDSMTDATAALQPVLPVSQNRQSFNGTGYQAFSPGVYAPLSGATGLDTSSLTTPNGKGWIVDGSGGVSFPTGTWSFTANVKENTNLAGTAHLVVGMWKVRVAGNAITSSTLLVDPSCSGAAPCGENPVNFITSGSGSATITQSVSVNAFSLQSNEHLYLQFWRRQTIGIMSVNATVLLATMFAYDGAADVTLPSPSPVPDMPAVVSPAGGTRTNNTAPTLSAGYFESDGNSGTLSFRLCADSGCSSVLQGPASTSTLASGTNGSWTPSGLADGTYYWQAQATDAASNVSGTTTSSFVVDTVPPGAPTLDSPAAGARVNTTQLGATFVDSDPSDSGTVSYQLCTNASCSSVVASGTSAVATPGQAVAFSPGSFPDGTYYWRLRATDVAGNATGWTASRSFVLDTNPPPVPSPASPADGAYLGAGVTLSGTFTNNDAGDSGTLDFQVCSDNLCNTVLGSGQSASGLANGATGSWTASGMAQGTDYWRVRAEDAAGNVSAWSATVRSFTYDTVAPTAPGPASVTARAQTPPQLGSTYADPGATDSGTLLFRICSNSGCTAVVQSHTVSSVANNTTVNWTPGSLADGLYYYTVTATDTAGNASSSSGSFTVDTVAPAKPALVSPANAARVNAPPQLNATFVDSDPTDSGTVTFRLCSDAACSTVLASYTTATPVGSGAAVSWTPTGPLADGTYYWQASAQDVALNQGAWSAVQSFVVDTTAPAVPTLGSVAAKVNSGPTLSATFSDPDVPDTGSIDFQVCSDSACTSVAASGSSPGGIANGASGSWTASGLADGAYYWRARAKDAAGNQSAWSVPAAQQFTLDTTPPPAPVQGSFTAGERISQPPTLTAVYNDPSGGPGSLTFEICATSSCSAPVLSYSGTTGSLASGTTGSWTPAFLFDGPYFWRVQSVDSVGNASPWSPALGFTIDATPPDAPVLLSPDGLRARSGPALTGRIEDPTDPGDQARLYIEICSDSACANSLANGYSGAVPVGTSAGWQAPALGDGTYYWRALGEDAAGNRGGWSATRTFVVDNSAPSVPAPSGLSDAAVVNTIRLSGTFDSSDPSDRGTLQFQVCGDAECTAVVLDGSSATVAAGRTASWTGDGALLDDGVYFWRVRSVDAAGNPSAWSGTRSFTLDQTPPGSPQGFKAKISGTLLTLTWRPPADGKNLRSYALIVNGKKTRTLKPKTHRLRIHLRRHDRRSFAIAAVDAAGNMSATRTIAAAGQRFAIKQARASAVNRP